MAHIEHLTWHPSGLTYAQRCKLRQQQGATLWLTGLSASGKSSIAVALEQALLQRNVSSYRLDGDNIRLGLNQDLDFGEHDRKENIRRISEVAVLFSDSCSICITSFISPFALDRLKARELHRLRNLPFKEVFVKVSLETAERRDPKGLYKKARQGQIPNFTGVDAPYEEPLHPDLVIETETTSIEQAVQQIILMMENDGILQRATRAEVAIRQI